VSRVVGDKAEVTEVTDTARARRRPQDGRETKASSGGTPWARAQSERVGEGAWLRAQLSGGGRVNEGGSIKGSGAWGHGRKSRGRGRVHGRVHRRFGGERSDRRAPRVREGAGKRMGFCADERDSRISERGQARADGFGADKSTPPGSEREREKRERVRDGADKWEPPVRGGRVCGRGRARG
jgi:hypothetical protein